MSATSTILGHERPITLLERARLTGRVAHAYLFHGPDGVGKEKVAFAFAKALNCTDADLTPCQSCESCSRIRRGNHPDVRLLASEEELARRSQNDTKEGHPPAGEAGPESQESAARSPSEQIRIAQLDELAGLFRHRPYLGRFKVVLVIDAERMNLACQNRFLKTLEEPTADTVILLLTAHPELLLPTVRSRCQALVFGPVPREQVTRFLAQRFGMPEDRARVIAAMSQGSLGRAVSLADGSELEKRDDLVSALASIRSGDLEALLGFAEDFREGHEGREQLREVLDLWELWCRDVLLAGLAMPGRLLINQDCAERLAAEAEAQSPGTVLRLLHQIRRTRTALAANANPRMALEALLLSTRTA